jgi:hypothetical protein
MEIIHTPITKEELQKKYMNFFKDMIKAVVDIEKEIIALDGELHADLESSLLEEGSYQNNLWGVNLYPLKDKENFIEYSALINIRPSQDNFSMEIENNQIKNKVKQVLEKLIKI